METEPNSQGVSDADLGAALREFRRHFPLQASAAWHYATERAKDMNVARELQQAQVVGADVARLMELVYVPGAWRCPKCNLRMIASTLSTGDGGIYANNKPQECANGCGSMWRVTEREDRQEAQRFAIEQAEALTPQSSAPVVGDDVAKAIQKARNVATGAAACNAQGEQHAAGMRRACNIIESALAGRGS